ncbi:MAG TPA: VIT family protein [Xanthobacteraceae bacterium]|nr:VIT family protein [Xanthobacteraceae bacterium]
MGTRSKVTGSSPHHSENHSVERIGWLRAAVLGANDGILSTASLIVGVAAAEASRGSVLIAGLAGLVAGAMSMAAGEYVSVSSQADTEKADIAREASELQDNPEAELDELTGIYVGRGLTPDLAKQVAEQLMLRDALGAHMRDELHLSEMTAARPVQAALTSAATFAAGAALPMLIATVAPEWIMGVAVTVSTLVFLAMLGAIGAAAGRAGMAKPVVRVTFWGALALAITAGIGKLFGTVV